MMSLTKRHIAVAIFTLAGSLSGALATYLLGVLGDFYEIQTYPERTGYILAAFVVFSYAGSCPIFLLSSREYAKILNTPSN